MNPGAAGGGINRTDSATPDNAATTPASGAVATITALAALAPITVPLIAAGVVSAP